MSLHKFFYRFKPIGIDFTDEREIRKYNSELTSFNCLEDQFTKLEYAYKNATKERADIVINVIPKLSGVIEISVFHKIKYKLFSRIVKSQCYSFCITQFDDSNQLSLFFHDTENFKEVKQIFQDFIENQAIPDLKNWKQQFIG